MQNKKCDRALFLVNNNSVMDNVFIVATNRKHVVSAESINALFVQGTPRKQKSKLVESKRFEQGYVGYSVGCIEDLSKEKTQGIRILSDGSFGNLEIMKSFQYKEQEKEGGVKPEDDKPENSKTHNNTVYHSYNDNIDDILVLAKRIMGDEDFTELINGEEKEDEEELGNYRNILIDLHLHVDVGSAADILNELSIVSTDGIALHEYGTEEKPDAQQDNDQQDNDQQDNDQKDNDQQDTRSFESTNTVVYTPLHGSPPRRRKRDLLRSMFVHRI